MFRRKYLELIKDPVWSRVYSLSLTLFFVMLADAIVSFWVPNLLEDTFKSPIMMGLVISFQSIVGLGADIIFPTLLRAATVKRFVAWGIVASICTSLALLGATFRPWVAVFLIAMTLWGIYYEFLAFAKHQFVADAVPIKDRAGAWGILGVFTNLAYFLGPMIGVWILLMGVRAPSYVAIFLTLISLAILFLSGKTHDRPMSLNIAEVNLVAELDHWRALFVRVWPIIILSLLLGFIDATYWTIGAVFSVSLAEKGIWGGLFLPMYALPSLFMGFIFVKWGIYSGKKKMAEKFLLASGIFLAGIAASKNVIWLLIMVFLSSTMLAIVYPLVDGVYSDIVARMGRERKHLIGLTSSTINLSYVIAPIVAGLIASKVGEQMTFSVLGGLTIFISLALLVVTPRKLKLPQEEIKTWN
ncbi:MFS transporter [Patescibacteria group bacterium]|nr:MFS transporter [Patescibacteria group bacterium]